MQAKVEASTLATCAMRQIPAAPIALHQGQLIDQATFSQEVARYTGLYAQQPASQVAIFYYEAYPFARSLFALWHAGKTVWLAANNKAASAEKLLQQGCILLGDWPDAESTNLTITDVTLPLSALDIQSTQLRLFTSGSSGEPQAVVKTLWQLQCEIDCLERQWGADLGTAQVLATVSQQHIYGLLFRVLWPLAYGRCFHSQQYASPEALVRTLSGQAAYWVASPAQLKRLDALSPWSQLQSLSLVFSSGGELPHEVAADFSQRANVPLLDIYGSSETGGIAWREPLSDSRWRAFTGISLDLIADQQYALHSPFLAAPEPYLLNDQLVLSPDGRFSLLGRSDRIVKLEEKRLSLVEMEQVLAQSAWVHEAHCRLVDGKRTKLAALIVLNADGLLALAQQGRNSLVKAFRNSLAAVFETILLPKKWLFIKQIPLNAQGKNDFSVLDNLLRLDGERFPQLQYLNQEDSVVELSLRVQADLRYFEGHFAGTPILPGVTQLAWAESYGQLFFAIRRPFSNMEVVKFKKIIQPEAILTLQLKWQAASSKLYFNFSSQFESHSSGRLIFGGQA